MQQRIHISYHPDFLSALAAKKERIDKQPNDNFQIRKRAKNFELVSRVTFNGAKAQQPVEGYTKKKKPKRLWKKSVDAQPFKMEYNNEKARANNTGKWAHRKGVDY